MKWYVSDDEIRANKIAHHRKEIAEWKDFLNKVSLPGNRLFADSQIAEHNKKLQALITKPQ